MARTDPESRRSTILDAAFTLFAERGYHAVTMREIAAAVGGSTGVLYHWFPGKEAIFDALLEREVARLVRDAVDAVPESDHREARLAAWVDRHVGRLRDLLRIALEYARERPEAQPSLAATVRGIRDAVRDQLGLVDADGILVRLFGVLVLGMFDPDAWSAAAVISPLDPVPPRG